MIFVFGLILTRRIYLLVEMCRLEEKREKKAKKKKKMSTKNPASDDELEVEEENREKANDITVS